MQCESPASQTTFTVKLIIGYQNSGMHATCGIYNRHRHADQLL